MVNFRRLSTKEFDAKHGDVGARDTDEVDLGSAEFDGLGEVDVPGLGWRPCAISTFTGEPVLIFNDVEGWLACPRNQPFEEVE